MQVASFIRPDDWEGSEALRDASSSASAAARVEGLRIRLTKLAGDGCGGGSSGSAGAAPEAVPVTVGSLLRLPVEVCASLTPQPAPMREIVHAHYSYGLVACTMTLIVSSALSSRVCDWGACMGRRFCICCIAGIRKSAPDRTVLLLLLRRA